jgi:hypothetical protein
MTNQNAKIVVRGFSLVHEKKSASRVVDITPFVPLILRGRGHDLKRLHYHSRLAGIPSLQILRGRGHDLKRLHYHSRLAGILSLQRKAEFIHAFQDCAEQNSKSQAPNTKS